MNKLFYVDNLDVLRDHLADESVALAAMFQGKKPDMPFVDPSSIKRAKREDVQRSQPQLL